MWLATMQHIAREGGCWVIGCATSAEFRDIPDNVPHRDVAFPDGEGWRDAGDVVVCKPFGKSITGPMH